MIVSGTIESSEKVFYWAYYNTSDTSYYIYWTNGSGAGIASGPAGSYDFIQNLTVSDNTIVAIFKERIPPV